MATNNKKILKTLELKVVALFGPDMRQLYAPLKEIYETDPTFALVGDGIKALTEADFSSIDGLINRHTRIDIYGHGSKSANGVHTISLMGDSIPTADVFKNLARLSHNEPLQVHLWSCYGGATRDDVKFLPVGSALVAHSAADDESWSGHFYPPALLRESSSNIFKNLLDDYEYYLGHPFVVSVNIERVLHYEYKPNLPNALSNPQQYIENSGHNLYNGLRYIEQQAYNSLIDKRAFHFPSSAESISYSADQAKTLLGYMFAEYCAYQPYYIIHILYSSPDYSAIIAQADRAFAEGNCLTTALHNNHHFLISSLLPKIDFDNIGDKLLTKAFSIAIAQRNIFALEELLTYGANIDGVDELGNTAMKYSIYNGDTKTALWLIEQGADLDIQTIDYSGIYTTYLMFAAAFGRQEVVESLLIHGVDSNVARVDGKTALMAAAQGGFPKIMKLLVEYGSNIDDINKESETALYDAIRSGNKEAVVFLLEHGANPNIQRLNEITPLIFAMYLDSAIITSSLLQYGAELDTQLNKYYTFTSSICRAVNTHVSSQQGFADVPKFRTVKAKKDLAAHPDHYHNYQCHDGDSMFASFTNEIGFYELICVSALHDEL